MSRADGRSGSKGLNVALRTALGTDGEPTVSRKAEHIRINLEEDVSAKGVTAGFERYRFVPCALPEIDLSDVDPQEFSVIKGLSRIALSNGANVGLAK